MFWKLENLGSSSRGIYDSKSQRLYGYGEVLDLVGIVETRLASPEKLLVAIVGDNSLATIIAYLAALRTGHATMLIGSGVGPELRDRIFRIYKPEIILFTDSSRTSLADYTQDNPVAKDISVDVARNPDLTPIHRETAVLLSTSGTTGSPKFIRLSYRNLESNANSICTYLQIEAGETAISSLPFSYSYGLSVLNTHLSAGANLVCTNASVVSRDFWSLFSEKQCTSFAGVPMSYEMLTKLRFEQMNLPSLRTMTQAGGRLGTERIRQFYDAAGKKGFRFFVMYGQTEATARISYVPWEHLGEKIGSVGIPVPGGKLAISPLEECSSSDRTEGELIYSGPNVMLGYALGRSCLAKGDEMRGVLPTGDIGQVDRDGFFYVTGRMRRFIKMYGLRISLDEVENMLESELKLPAACTGKDDVLWVLLQSTDNQDIESARNRISSLYKLHHTSFQVRGTEVLPTLSSGKKDYKAIVNYHE